jgi:SAM-dependent methyltransferase
VSTSDDIASAYVRRLAGGTDPGRRDLLARECARALTSVQPQDLPPRALMQVIGSPDAEHFLLSMRAYFPELTVRCRIPTSAHVLDIGCGAGRLALPFAQYLDDQGALWGVDVWQEGVEWCAAHITSAARTSFRTLSIENNYYFEALRPEVRNSVDLGFIPDGSLDLAYAISVFSHLRYQDLDGYLRELRRTLKPDGLAYLTGFVMDRYFGAYRTATGLFGEVDQVAPGQFLAYSGQDTFSAFDMATWMRAVQDNGLYALCFETGEWADKPGSRLYQDLFILGRVV